MQAILGIGLYDYIDAWGFDDDSRIDALDTFLESFINDLQFDDFQNLVKEVVDVSGVIARHAVYDFVRGDVAGQQQTLLFFFESRFYGITFTTREDLEEPELSAANDEFDRFMSSISLPEEREPPESEIATVPEGVLFEQDGVTLTLRSLEMDSRGGADLNVHIENDGNDPITVQVRDVSVNDIMFTSTIFSSSVTPGNARNDSITFASWGFERYGITEIGTIELNFRVINDDNRNASFNTEQIVIETSLADQIDQPLPETQEVLYERDGVTISLIEVVEDRNNVDVVFFIVNDTERTLTIQARDEAINGLMISGIKSTGIMPGKMAVDTLSFSGRRLEENGIAGIGDIEIIRFVLRVIDDNNRNATFDTPTLEVVR